RPSECSTSPSSLWCLVGRSDSGKSNGSPGRLFPPFRKCRRLDEEPFGLLLTGLPGVCKTTITRNVAAPLAGWGLGGHWVAAYEVKVEDTSVYVGWPKR